MLTLCQVKKDLEEMRDDYARYLKEAEASHCTVYQVAGRESLRKMRVYLVGAMQIAAKKNDLEIYNMATVLYNGVSSAMSGTY